jgi:hypothetical protein
VDTKVKLLALWWGFWCIIFRKMEAKNHTVRGHFPKPISEAVKKG